MKRFLTALLLLAAGAASAGEHWSSYKDRFVTRDGRVVDSQNGNMSHSEGQGYTLLLAAHYGDREAFETVWRWTDRSLAVRSDGLLAWAWDPAKEKVKDRNGATDGDLLVAWALLRGAKAFEEPRYRDIADRITRAVVQTRLPVRAGERLIVPGPTGFEHGAFLTVNPSYWVTPAIRDLHAEFGYPELLETHDAGLRLLRRLHTAGFGMAPDWVAVGQDGALTKSSVFPLESSFDAVRVPLYLIWGCERSHPLVRSHFERFRTMGGEQPLVWDLEADRPKMRGIHPAYQAIEKLMAGVDPRPSAPATEYYPAVIEMLAGIASVEEKETCGAR
jgi:endoglucanase